MKITENKLRSIIRQIIKEENHYDDDAELAMIDRDRQANYDEERARSRFTARFVDETEKPHFINSATSGLHLALNIFKKRYKWKDGDEVITTPLTFVSTNHVILYERLKPVFADVDEFLCLDPNDIINKITPRTKAVIFVGLGGNAGRLDKISNICKQKGIKLKLYTKVIKKIDNLK